MIVAKMQENVAELRARVRDHRVPIRTIVWLEDLPRTCPPESDPKNRKWLQDSDLG